MIRRLDFGMFLRRGIRVIGMKPNLGELFGRSPMGLIFCGVANVGVFNFGNYSYKGTFIGLVDTPITNPRAP